MTFTRAGGNSKITPGPNGNLHTETKKMTMAGLVDFISRYYDRPLVDMTRVNGAYDMELDVSGEEVRNERALTAWSCQRPPMPRPNPPERPCLNRSRSSASGSSLAKPPPK